MSHKKKKQKRVIELGELNVVLGIPANAQQVKITCKIPYGDDNKLVKAKKKLTEEELKQARQFYLDHIDDPDDVLTLTDPDE